MPSPSEDVDQLIAELDHPMKPAVQQLRSAILLSNRGITEQVKWKAPSFCFAGEDRVTFRLHPRGSLQLIFIAAPRSGRTAPSSGSRTTPA